MQDLCGLLSDDAKLVFVGPIPHYRPDVWVMTGYDPRTGRILYHKLGRKIGGYETYSIDTPSYQVFEVAGVKEENVPSRPDRSGSAPLFGVLARMVGEAATGLATDGNGAGPSVT